MSNSLDLARAIADRDIRGMNERLSRNQLVQIGLEAIAEKQEKAKKKRKVSSRLPAERTMELLRNQGYLVGKTEFFNTFTRTRVDLFGFIDLIAIRGDERGAIAIQACQAYDINKHIEKLRGKIEKESKIPPEKIERARLAAQKRTLAVRTWLAAGNQIWMVGWRKLESTKRWEPIIRTVSLEDLKEPSPELFPEKATA